VAPLKNGKIPHVETKSFQNSYIKEKRMDTIKVSGMSCQHCVSAVTKALEKLEGLEKVAVDLTTNEVSFVNNGVEREKIRSAISQIGFDPGE
jgi:copper chaperone